jgi:hypothetical protein
MVAARDTSHRLLADVLLVSVITLADGGRGHRHSGSQAAQLRSRPKLWSSRVLARRARMGGAYVPEDVVFR